jgi:hypothetical protein
METKLDKIRDILGSLYILAAGLLPVVYWLVSR